VNADKNLLQDVLRVGVIDHPPADERQQPAAVLIPQYFQELGLHEFS
jgi:hypothetical protein